MHEHKFILVDGNALCQHEGCMYVIAQYEIEKILAQIANSLAAQQSVQWTCAQCGEHYHKDVAKVTIQKSCVSCGASH